MWEDSITLVELAGNDPLVTMGVYKYAIFHI